MPTMTITEARPLIETLIDACEPVMLWGMPGIGKTQLPAQIARAKKMGFIDRFRAPCMDSVDLTGVPSVENGFTRWNPPELLPNVRRDGLHGILLLDEINAGTVQLMASLFGFILERRQGGYDLPDGWTFVATGNRVSQSTAAHNMPQPLNDRFFHIDLVPDFPAWKIWALANGIMVEIVDFLEWCERRGSSLLHKMPATKDERCFPTPRGWEKVSKACKLSPSQAYQIASARVGDAAAAEFKGFLDIYRSLPTIPEVIASPDSARLPLEPSAQFAVCSALARAADCASFAAIIKYATRISADFATLTVLSATKRNAQLKQAPGYSAWAIANPYAA